MDPIDGTLKLHMVSGTWERGEQLLVVQGDNEVLSNKTVKTFKLKLDSMPWLMQRRRDEPRNMYQRNWNEREEWIHESRMSENHPPAQRRRKCSSMSFWSIVSAFRGYSIVLICLEMDP
jgi:hypothetical protein